MSGDYRMEGSKGDCHTDTWGKKITWKGTESTKALRCGWKIGMAIVVEDEVGKVDRDQ